MLADLEGILKLNAVDTEIFHLTRKKSEYPAEMERLQADITRDRGAADTFQNRIDNLETEHRQLEIDIQELKDSLRKSEDRLMQIKTNEEYDAVHTEIASRKRKLADVEDRLLHIDGDKENARTRQQEAADKLNNDDFKAKEAKLEEIKTIFSGLEAQIAEKTAARTEAAKGIAPAVMAVYERLRGAHAHKVVGIVTDDRRSCSACGCSLTPQRFIVAKRNNSLAHCEACGALLVWQKSDEVKA